MPTELNKQPGFLNKEGLSGILNILSLQCVCVVYLYGNLQRSWMLFKAITTVC